MEESDGLFLLGVIVCDLQPTPSREKIDLGKTIPGLERPGHHGYHTYPQIPLAALGGSPAGADRAGR